MWSVFVRIHTVCAGYFYPTGDEPKVTRDVGPNITGKIKMQSDANFINTNGGGYVDGAFYLGVSAPYGVNGNSGNRSSVFHFSASRSSGLYGQGSSVQPLSLKCLACIKV